MTDVTAERDAPALPADGRFRCDGGMPTTQLFEATRRPSTDSFWRRPFRLIRENARVYLTLSLAAYGLVALGFALGILFPELPAARAVALEADGTGELVRAVAESAPLFALVIFAVNVFRLGLFTIVLPSLVVPFAGLAFFGYWAVETGITLVQTTPVGWVAMIPHTLTVLIELQAYVLFLLGAYLLGRAWLVPPPYRGDEPAPGVPRGTRKHRAARSPRARAPGRRRPLGGVLAALPRPPAEPDPPLTRVHAESSLTVVASPSRRAPCEAR